MEKLGSIPVIEVPEVDFGYLQIPEHAGKTFIEAFSEKFKHLGDLLNKSISGHCKFNDEGILEGSNSFVLSLIREGNIKPEEEFLYSPKDFARAFNRDPEKFNGFYQDLGLAVTISPDQAKEKSEQLRELAQGVYDAGFRKASPNSPIFVPHTALSPDRFNNTHHFAAKFHQDIVEAPAYANNNTTKKFNEYNKETGVPLPEKSGDNNIYTVPQSPGVFQVCSNNGQSASASCVGLADSDSDGRVAVGSVIPKECSEVSKEIKQAKKQIASIKRDLEQKVAKL